MNIKTVCFSEGAEKMRRDNNKRRQHFAIELIIIFIWMFFLTACKGGKIEVHPLKNLTHVMEFSTYEGEKQNMITEYFIVSNMPAEKDAVKKVVRDYNSKTLSDSDLKKYDGRFRNFYRETRKTPRDYQEKDRGVLSGWDRIEDHSDDLVLTVKWIEHGKVEEYEFWSDVVREMRKIKIERE
jgi:hypothetical protein